MFKNFSYNDYFSSNSKHGEVNKSPTMTQDEFYLPAKQRVQNLLLAGRNLMDYRASLNDYEQNSLNVDESNFDTTELFDDLHDYNSAMVGINEKYSVKKGTTSVKPESVEIPKVESETLVPENS